MLEGRLPAEAARLASLHTAEYVESRRPTLRAGALERRPLSRSPDASAIVVGGREGASAEWLLDEAISGLWDLGVRARAHQGDAADVLALAHEGETILLLNPQPFMSADRKAWCAIPNRVVVYSEGTEEAVWPERASVKTELAAALYAVAWTDLP